MSGKTKPLTVTLKFCIGEVHQAVKALQHRMKSISSDITNTEGTLKSKNQSAYENVSSALSTILIAVGDSAPAIKGAFEKELEAESESNWSRSHHKAVTLSIAAAVAIESALSARLAQLQTTIERSDTSSASERADLMLAQRELAAVTEAKQAINAAYSA